MLIHFRCGWLKPGTTLARGFKAKAAFELFSDYQKRIQGFGPCQVSPLTALPINRGTRWLCDRSAGAEILSSEKLAGKLKTLQLSGVKELEIIIGGLDGFTPREIEDLKPSMRWSFGPLTLPHELAAVVAAEQIYRAFAILNNLPYHRGH